MFRSFLPTQMRAFAVLAVVALFGLVACDQDNREDSPLQADQDVVDEVTPAVEGADTPSPADDAATGDDEDLEDTGSGLQDSPGADRSEGIGADDDDDSLETDVEAEVEPTVVDAVVGDDVTVVGVLERHLSDQVLTLNGVTFAEQPAEELIVVIPPELSPDYEALDEGSLVAVAGEVVQITRERLAEVDESIFQDHGELLEGFRSAWGILASDVSVAEEGDG